MTSTSFDTLWSRERRPLKADLSLSQNVANPSSDDTWMTLERRHLKCSIIAERIQFRKRFKNCALLIPTFSSPFSLEPKLITSSHLYLVITNDDNGSEIRIKIMLNTVVTREKKNRQKYLWCSCTQHSRSEEQCPRWKWTNVVRSQFFGLFAIQIWLPVNSSKNTLRVVH